MAPNGRMIRAGELRSMYLADKRATVGKILEAIETGDLAVQQFSLRALAEGIMGPEWVRNLEPARDGGLQAISQRLDEAAAVDSTAFSNITGQIVYTTLLESFRRPDLIGYSNCVTVVPTEFRSEKIAGIRIESTTEKASTYGAEIPEGMPYPIVGVSEEYRETPSTKKQGLKIPVTKEAIRFDRTGLLLERVREIGDRLAIGREFRILDVVLGVVNNYKYGGTSYNTYLTVGNWINQAAGDLIDWTDVDEVQTLQADLTGWDGLPVVVGLPQVLVMPARKAVATKIFRADMLADTPAGSTTQTIVKAGAMGWNPDILVSVHAYNRLIASGVAAANAKQYWFSGDFKRAFEYRENWPLTVEMADASHPDNFDRDVMVQYKASEMGIAAVREPRYAFKRTN